MSTRTCLNVFGIAFLACASIAHAGDAPDKSKTKVIENSSPVHKAIAAGDANRALELLRDPSIWLPPAERRSLEGRAHFILGDHVIARRKLEAALRLRPGEPKDLYWLGRAYAAAGSHLLAMQRYDAALAGGLQSADLHLYWARSLREIGELFGTPKSIPWKKGDGRLPSPGTVTSQGVVIGPAPKRDGWIMMSSGGAAIDHVYLAMSVEPNNVQAMLLLAELWAEGRDHVTANQCFTRVAGKLTNKDDLVQCHRAWAASLLAMGDLDGYLAHTRDAMGLTGQIDNAALAQCYDNASRTVCQRGDIKRQIEYLSAAVELAPTTDRCMRLAGVLETAQRGEDARRYLQLALDQNPTSTERRKIEAMMQRFVTLASPDP